MQAQPNRAQDSASTPKLVSIPTFASTIGVSLRSAYRVLSREEVRVTRVGGRTLVALSEIDKYIAAHSGAFRNGAA